jgi:hypothetical protein
MMTLYDYKEPEGLANDIIAKGKRVDPESENYVPVSFLDNQNYFDTLDKAMSSKEFLGGIRSSVNTLFNAASGGLSKSDETFIRSSLIEYPKAIIDHNAIPRKNSVINEYAKPIVNLGVIKLPFPRLTLVVTEAHDTDFPSDTPYDKLPTWDWKKSKTRVEGINGFCFIFLDQVDSECVRLSLPIVHGPTKKIQLYQILLAVEGNDISSYVEDNGKQVIVMDQSNLSFTVKMALYAVNKMTISGGEIYLDKPTPRSIQVNKKKLNKRKNPTIEFRLIKIDGYKPQLPSLPQGTHASPRQHWRRGHWRNLASGKRVFVKPMLVGDEKNGKIIKDYIVEEPAHAH